VGIDTAYQVSPSSGCDDIKTLLPFRIINITTGNKVNLVHYDKGIDGFSDSSDPAYGNCQWSRREPIVFKEIGVNPNDLDDDEWTYDLRIDWMILQEEEDFLYPWINQNIINSSVDIITPKFLHDGDYWEFDFIGGSNLSNSSESLLPTEFSLNNPYPNPFNPTTQIKYEVSNISNINFIIYDINGRVIDQFRKGIHVPGYYSFEWNASNQSSGIYFVKMIADEYPVKVKKITLIK